MSLYHDEWKVKVPSLSRGRRSRLGGACITTCRWCRQNKDNTLTVRLHFLRRHLKNNIFFYIDVWQQLFYAALRLHPLWVFHMWKKMMKIAGNDVMQNIIWKSESNSEQISCCVAIYNTEFTSLYDVNLMINSVHYICFINVIKKLFMDGAVSNL